MSRVDDLQAAWERADTLHTTIPTDEYAGAAHMAYMALPDLLAVVRAAQALDVVFITHNGVLRKGLRDALAAFEEGKS